MQKKINNPPSFFVAISRYFMVSLWINLYEYKMFCNNSNRIFVFDAICIMYQTNKLNPLKLKSLKINSVWLKRVTWLENV